MTNRQDILNVNLQLLKVLGLEDDAGNISEIDIEIRPDSLPRVYIKRPLHKFNATGAELFELKPVTTKKGDNG
ncbi:hypothetical protein TPMD03_14 [Thiohalocapsa phage LS06-2018-MD03]|nr:hypothetical protein TPMD03_14 [Thiohalocapsa phage LS06-2018-MD03]